MNEGARPMTRRELVQQVAWLMGGALSTPAVLAVLQGCKRRESARATFLTEPQLITVAIVAEVMLPRTDTPGAEDVGVPLFIDTMLEDAYSAADQERFITGLEQLEADARQLHRRAFPELDSGRRAALVQRVHDAAVAQELPRPPAQLARPFILMVKELTLLGFFTSRPGATQVLQYDPVPGVFRACVPLAQAGNGRTWAVETSRRF